MLPLALLLTSLLPLQQDSPSPQWGRRIEWAKEGAPLAREHAALIVDPVHSRAVMIGGSGYQPYGKPLADAWAFDWADEAWSPLKLSGDEFTAGGSRRAASVENGAFLHGGYGRGFAPVGVMWQASFEQDEVVLTRVDQENAPPARLLHAFTCDPSGEYFVVYGGGGEQGVLDDTWIGRRTDFGVEWELLETENSPGGRYGFSFALDAKNGRLLVCGGEIPPPEGEEAMTTARDLWSLDFTAEKPSWTLLAEYDAEIFPGRRNPAWAFDEKSGDLFVWGGTGDGSNALPGLYVLSTRAKGAPVTRLSQPASIPTRCSGFGVIDSAGGRALLGFGNTAQGRYSDLVEIKLR